MAHLVGFCHSSFVSGMDIGVTVAGVDSAGVLILAKIVAALS